MSASPPLGPEEALAQLTAQRREQRRAEALRTRGVRALLYALVAGSGAAASTIVAPPAWYASVVVLLGGLAIVLAAFGVLCLVGGRGRA